jgi:sugar O-acyltransferase (sialic acid O-acetyltransferase NeuD family)
LNRHDKTDGPNGPVRACGFGAGGHAKVVIDIIRLCNKFDIVALLDKDPTLKRSLLCGIEIAGDDTMLPALMKEGVTHFFIGVGGIGDTQPRRRIFEFAIANGLIPVDAIHPGATLSSNAHRGAGVTIMAGVQVGPDARLGRNVIVNTAAIVEHDCEVGDHVHLSPGAVLCGGVTVGAGAHIGAGAVVRQGIAIGAGALVGAGAVVVKNVDAGACMMGNPAKPRTKR